LFDETTFSTLATCLPEWQGRAGRLFTQTHSLIYGTELAFLRNVPDSAGTANILITIKPGERITDLNELL
jgi:hypothetical protein